MAEPVVTTRAIGAEAQLLAIVDDFALDPAGLRAFAAAAAFEPAGQHYPGIRAALPDDYFQQVGPALAAVLRDAFGHEGRVDVIDASFSIVTTPAGALAPRQRLPHCDAFAKNRIALLHYLSPGDCDGTAFFRHRSTGYETIDERRAPFYFRRLDDELRAASGPPHGYIAGDTALFERIALAEPRYNRALLYRSYALHSGAIAPDAALSPDPDAGRLTITGFLSLG